MTITGPTTLLPLETQGMEVYVNTDVIISIEVPTVSHQTFAKPESTNLRRDYRNFCTLRDGELIWYKSEGVLSMNFASHMRGVLWLKEVAIIVKGISSRRDHMCNVYARIVKSMITVYTNTAHIVHESIRMRVLDDDACVEHMCQMRVKIKSEDRYMNQG